MVFKAFKAGRKGPTLALDPEDQKKFEAIREYYKAKKLPKGVQAYNGVVLSYIIDEVYKKVSKSK